ncbi:hypothetical protein PAHAL_7G086900 [Panicum hallii]|jgi:hypothetical protein|uniref:Uncharacterized protein n=1 Tax=Panicum hallii TaxID=206008 RepID=A0A2S3I5N7_9POAL|nr:hypothetical protein PAHAL_7G086900 [Panicum hallii]
MEERDKLAQRIREEAQGRNGSGRRLTHGTTTVRPGCMLPQLMPTKKTLLPQHHPPSDVYGEAVVSSANGGAASSGVLGRGGAAEGERQGERGKDGRDNHRR